MLLYLPLKYDILYKYIRMKRVNGRSGYALISVIWTIAVLSLMLASFTMDTFIETKVATYTYTRHQATALMDSGLCIASLLMERQEDVTGEETEEELLKDRWIEPAIRLKRGQRVEVRQQLKVGEDGRLYFMTSQAIATKAETAESSEALAEAEIVLAIEPEPARWNLNKLSRAGYGDNADLIWGRILELAGVPEEEHGILIDSFYDWVDEDSLETSADGAETDYYENLEPNPYACKNAALDTIGELAYIRGFDTNNGVLLKGGIWNPKESESRQITVSGIEHLFSLYGDGKINVNAAPREVLLTVPCFEDSDGLIVDTILEEREGLNADSFGASTQVRQTARGASLGTAAIEDYSFKDISDFLARIPGISQEDANTYLTVDCEIYKLELEGRVGNIRRRATAIVQRGGSASKKNSSGLTSAAQDLTILRWQEEI